MANTGILTKKHNVEVANLFYRCSLQSNSNYYVFLGKHIPWEDDNNPPVANDSIFGTQLSVYSDLLFGKKVTENNIRRLAPRYTWTSNTAYSQYDPRDSNLYANSFYIINSSNNVYKILDNNAGSRSTVEPFLVSTDAFRTADGYTWKYMYSISQSDMTNFACGNFIPVLPDANVQSSAVSGSIDVIRVANSGTGYVTYSTGYLQSVVDQFTITLSSNSASNNNFYTNSSIYLKSGFGAGQLRKITSYNGSNKIATVQDPFDFYIVLTLANTTGTFAVGDEVSQDLSYLVVTSKSGYFQPGDILEQYIPGFANATGRVITTGDNIFKVELTSTQAFVNGVSQITSRGTTLRTGTVDVANNSNTVTGNSTSFTTEYNTGDYIKIGNTSPEFYRITSVANATQLTIAGPSLSAYSNANHFEINSGLTISSVTNVNANGQIVFADLDTVKLTIADTVGVFNLGEIITQGNSSTNGVISFANTSTLVVTNIEGPGFQASNSTVNFPIAGFTSAATANVTIVSNLPTVTLLSTNRNFTVGSNVSSSGSGAAFLAGIATIPDEQTEYIISPTVKIVGDGTGASAYSVVNTSLTTIESIVVVNPGSDYIHPDTTYNTTTATIEANGTYGTGAVLYPVISPVGGHGADPYTELGANYIGITAEFGNTSNEQYNFSVPTTFRRVGLIKNIEFNDVWLTISDYDRVKLTVSNVSNTLVQGEILYQPSTNAAGVVVYSNSSFIELKNVKGTFVADTANDDIYAFSSSTTANVDTAIVSVFEVTSNNQSIVQEQTGAFGTLVFANTSVLKLTNARGNFTNGYMVYDSSTNSYGTVAAGGIKIANNSKATTFSRFNNTMRLTLSSNTRPYTNNETVHFKTSILDAKYAQAAVLSGVGDIDLQIDSPTVSFTVNEVITQGTANAIVLYANSTYLKLTQIQGTFTNTANVQGVTSTAQANVVAVYPVLFLSDVENVDVINTSNTNYIYGITSGANGFCSIANTITYPELVRDTGSVLYIENISPVTKSSTSKETVKLVIKF